MKPLKTIALFLMLVPAFVALQGKPKKPYVLPAVFNQASYVYVEAVGGQEFDPKLYPEDREAIADVEKALQRWNRYVLVTRRDDADLIFIVRKGRAAEARVGVQAGSGPQRAPQPSAAPGSSHGFAVGGEVGPPDDLLEVCVPNPNDAHGTLLWQRTLADGLNPARALSV